MTTLQLGLVSNIIGTVLIFICGFPSLINNENTQGLMSTGELSKEDDKKRRRKNIIVKSGGYTGILLLLVGFIIQYLDTKK
jgi:hypothetical protein